MHDLSASIFELLGTRVVRYVAFAEDAVRDNEVIEVLRWLLFTSADSSRLNFPAGTFQTVFGDACARDFDDFSVQFDVGKKVVLIAV